MLRVLMTAVLFAAFIPGVLFRLPPHSSRWVVLAVHGVLFVVVLGFASRLEGFGNYGPTCPNGYSMTASGDCVPTGHATYDLA